MKQAQPTYSAYTQEDMDALYGTRPATTNSQAPECPEGYVPYTIEAGDTLRSIASSRGITVNELLFYNPTLSPYGYKKGDVLCVPGTGSAASAGDAAPAGDAASTEGTSAPSGSADAGSSADSAGDGVAAEPGTGPEALPTPSLPGEDGASDADPETPATPGTGPLPLPTPSLPSTPPQPSTPTPSVPSIPVRPGIPVRPSVPAAPVCESGTLYTVRPGDTLRRIAQGFGVTLDALMEANPGTTNNRLIIGQRLCIPCVPCEEGCAQGTTAVRIRSTDFVDYLVNYNISYAALAAANPQTDLGQLTAGGTLCIPPAGSRGTCAGGSGTQELESDTTAAVLAESLGVSIAALLQYNPTFTPMDFRRGRLICVPPQS